MDTLPGYQDALRLALAAARAPASPRRRPLRLSIGATLAESILADRDQPPFDRATMDGYALRAADAQAPCSGAETKPLKVIGDLPAGAPPSLSVGPGEAAKISTGAPLPPGADAVVRHEWTDRGFPFVKITAETLRPRDCVHPRGADAMAGDVVLPAGTVIAPHHLGAAAAVGATCALVHAAPPIVTILTSGDEVLPPDTPTDRLAPHQIRSSNGPMLESMLPFFGAVVGPVAHVADDAHATRRAVEAALEDSDVLVTVGGVSAGERDHFPAAFAACDVLPALRGAAIQPGRPIFVGRRERDGALVVALPGNPVSVLATAHLFLWPIIRALRAENAALPWREVTLAAPVRPNARRQSFRPCVLSSASALVPDWAGSGDLIHTVPTHGLLELPAQDAPIEPGARLQFLPWAWSHPAGASPS